MKNYQMFDVHTEPDFNIDRGPTKLHLEQGDELDAMMRALLSCQRS